MNKPIFTVVLAGLLVAAASVDAASLKCKLIMPGDKSWEGSIVGRDGDWIEFSTGASPRPIRVGASTIKELEFEVEVDLERLNILNREREYENIISVLERMLAPFAEYDDIPSNLTPYKSSLMETYYKVKNYDLTLGIAAKLAKDDRNPELQERSRVYQALALIDAGQAEEAQAVMSKYGWDQNLGEDAPPEKLYIMAKLLALKKDYSSAMELVAKIIAFNSQNPEWMQPAEFFCAEIYTELGMYDSAEEVIRQISLLYKDTNEDDMAQKLKLKIEKLRAEKELQESLETTEEA
ncbi:tetratricopeptide repeat protein [Pontiella sp.]|uniref:tetratricopeptide repeat protein n=1 Tax=Pontiella sp. TaxID=2837462 RepID=UPI0035693B73